MPGHNASAVAGVAICYYGLLRSLPEVMASHRAHLLDVLMNASLDVRVFVHNWRPAGARENEGAPSIISPLAPRAALEDDEIEFLRWLEPRWDLYFNVTQQVAYERMVAVSRKRPWLGAAWSPAFSAISGPVVKRRNTLCGLESLKRVFALALANDRAWWETSCRFVVFVRPDTRFLSRFPVNDMLSLRDTQVLVPSEDQWFGTNDRFAACRRAAASTYANRIDEASAFHMMPHYGSSMTAVIVAFPEALLSHSLAAHGIRAKRSRDPRLQIVRSTNYTQIY